VSRTQAHTIKTRYGLEPSKKQAEILDAIRPELDKLMGEIRKMIRYYNERASEDALIGQIIILGGGANLPGLSTYITDQIRIPTRLCDPWQNISFGGLQAPHQLETTLYTTAAGLSLIGAEELAAS
jgi:Tfp pilus assembly PilM family ATPase